MSESWDNWEWRQNPSSIEVAYELFDGERMLAWVIQRPHYCNRGHFLGVVDCVADLDHQDGWPNYYMDIDRAKAEIEAFLKWRLFKVRDLERSKS